MNETAQVRREMLPSKAFHFSLLSLHSACGSWLITWENFFLVRDTNSPVNAQVELGSDAFFVRSNEIERVYQRIDPDDWDGDDVPNAWDPNPYVGDGIETDLEQVLPEGANEDAYCWVELTSERHTRVSFTGDGYSNLPDPSFMLRSGDVCRVALLIGKTYTVTSDQSLYVVDQSDCNIEIEGDGTTLLTICWPVEIYAIEGNGNSFMMDVYPNWLCGVFTWTEHCCQPFGSGTVFRYGCSGSCGCNGCCAEGFYRYEGYPLLAEGGWCGCTSDGSPEDPDDRTGVTVAFSKHAIIFEDEYDNAPGDHQPWRLTETELTCAANGGPNGGTVAIEMAGNQGLVQYTGSTLPIFRTLGAYQTIRFAKVIEPDGIVCSNGFNRCEDGYIAMELEPYITPLRVCFCGIQLMEVPTTCDGPSGCDFLM